MFTKNTLLPSFKGLFIRNSTQKINGHFTEKIRWPIFLFNTGILVILATFLMMRSFHVSGLNTRGLAFENIRDYIPILIKGYMATLIFSVLILTGSLFYGALFCILDRSKLFLLRIFVYWVVQICRGTPIIVFLIFSYYIIGQALGLQNRNLAAVIILSIYYSTAVSEIIRGGFRSISPTQFEVADGFGLSPLQTYRYVIFPQLIQRILPAMTNQIGIIIRGTSLISLIGVAEFYQTATNVASQTYAAFECYIFLAVGYLCITFPISLLTKLLERNHGRD